LPVPADEQQAQLLECLRAAGGRPVSFEELRQLGIENPAVLCYELDLQGAPIDRVHHYVAPGRPVAVGVRLEVSADGAAGPPPRPSPGESARATALRWRSSIRHAFESARAGSAPRARSARAAASRWGSSGREALESARARRAASAPPARTVQALTPGWRTRADAALEAARVRLRPAFGGLSRRAGAHKRGVLAGAGTLLLIAVAAATLALTGSTSRPAALGGVRGAVHARASRASGPRSGLVATPILSAGALAALQAEGHKLLGEERYTAAIGDLRRAVAGSGESSTRCAASETEACLSYAYALFDLGRALRLNGDRAGAVAILSERLRIDNQREAVQEELNQATEGSAGATASSK
jgi:hypothetical protein